MVNIFNAIGPRNKFLGMSEKGLSRLGQLMQKDTH